MSARPQLLFVAPWFLFPTTTGGRIRSADILRGLKGGRFEVTLASPAPDDPAAFGDELSRACDRFVSWPAPRRGPLWSYTRLRHILADLPISVATDRWPAATAKIAAELSRRPDVVVVDFVHTAVLMPPMPETPSVLFTHNVEAEIFRRHAEVAGNPMTQAIWCSQHRKMERFEDRILKQFKGVIAVSNRDASHFRSRYGVENISVIPTGVDLNFFQPPPGQAAAGLNLAGETETLVFTGSMDWMANIDGIEFFMTEVWPILAAARPKLRFVVVGRNPPEALVEKARQRSLPWEFTGFVDDVRPYVHGAQAYVIPLRVGGGTRLKVFEAMAMGSPVVSTAIGVEGLPLEPGQHYLAADTAESFATEVLRLLDDAELRRRIAISARQHVEQNFSSQVVADRFDEICARIAGLGTEQLRGAAAR